MQDQRSKSNWRGKLKKGLMAWITVLVFALPIAGVVATRPQPALAQGAPTIDIANLTQNLGKFIKDVVLEGLKQGAALAFKNALKVFVSQIAYDTAVWIGSGDENQKPLLYTKDVGSYLTDVGDAAAGEFLNTLFSENGYFEYDLCQPLDVDVQLYLNLAIGIAIPQSDYSILGIQLPEGDLPVVECTFSDIIENFEDASLDVDFATQVAVLFIPTNNDFGVYSSAVGAGYELQAAQSEEAVIDRLKGDFTAVDGNVSGYIATPGSVVEHQYFLSLDASSYPQTTYTGQLLADTIDIFTSTLISKLLERLKTGLIADFTTPDITDSLSGSSSTSGGISAAEEKYLSFKEIPITRGGDIDILSDLANCPDQGAEITNCAIDEGFRLAIEQGKTVQQALDEGLIDGGKPFAFGESGIPVQSAEEGIQYRSTIILKHYRIIPVGWQIAAEYLRDFGGGTSITLQDLVDAYDQCDLTDYSPFCKLVDPDWVLTSPAGICNLQAYGQTIYSARFEDDDGLVYTPERPNVLRAQTCVDDQTCLKTDSDGNCIAYGYCTEEKRIYRFQGDECPEQNSSCQTYSDSNGDEVSYLRNTLNFNNCDANSVGCQWYCQVYNDVNLEWQCADNGRIYETCSSDSDEYDSSSDTCACEVETDAGTETCDMQDGAFKCTTDTGTACTLNTLRDSTVAFDCSSSSSSSFTSSLSTSLCPVLTTLGIGGGSGVDSAINFNNQVETCNEEDAGCTTFIETTTGANLIFNSSFEYFNSYNDAPEDVVRGDSELSDTTFDTFGFYSADSTDPGTACEADSSGEECIGWEKSGRVFATSDDVFDGFVSAELEGSASLTYELETGYGLADRTFDLSFMSQNTGTTGCVGEVTLNGALLENLDYTGGSAANVAYEGDDTWTNNSFEAYTYPSTTTDTQLSLTVTVPSTCSSSVKLDAFDLTETDDSSDYTAYGTTEEISMNGDRLECAVEDVGCELYTPEGGSSADAIPGQITNTLSDACTGTDGFKDPSCSQCNGTTSDAEFVGCDFYQEQPLTNAAPVPSLSGFSTVPTGDERDGIVQRTGYYCNNDGFEGVSCYDDSDCGGTAGACVDSISIIPSTAEVCSAQYVGCEEFTNLDVVSEGGEGLEYYSYIKQCVKDTPEQRDNDEIDTYVTFEGSDVSGYSLRSFDLKKSNVDDGPCTNLDLYGSTAQSSEADCIDTSATQKTCTAADVGVDADCTEFIDPDTGTSYYRLKSYTITASDDCHPLRNSLDGRTYYSVPSESTSCPVSQNLCREYKGSAGGDVFEAINEDFEDSVWDQASTTGTVEQSSESTAAGGHSMHLAGASASYDLFTEGDEGTVSSLDEGKTYVIELWAKEVTGGSGLDIYFYSATSASADASVYFVENSTNSISAEAVTLDDDWHKYTFGPVVMPRAGEEDDQLIITWDVSTDFYVDNVILEESDAQYLIKDTADTCTGYEGCEEYTDREGDTHYIKSFSRLCEEQFVGCEAIIDTANSDSPFTQTFLTDNDFTSTDGPVDDVTVSEDQVVAFVNDEDNYCTESAAGCTELGQPEVDEVTGEADSYTTVYYLNDPDEYTSILCETDALSCDEYTSSNDEVVYFKNPGDRTCEYRQETSGTDFAWFIIGTDTECPLFDDSETPGQPSGAICDGGERDGLFCVSDDDCPDDDTTDDDEPHCRNDLTTDDDGDGYPDSGWTGTCSTAYSGCTEYQDPNTDNLVPNGGFEEDVYTYDSSNGETDESVEASDGVPDYFEEFSFLSCDTLAQNTSESHTGTDSLQIAQDGLVNSGDGIGCAVTPEERIEIDPSKTYTLSANVMVPNAYNSANNSTVSIGLYYYDADGNFLLYDYDGDGTTGALDIDDFVQFNLAAEAEEIESTEEGVWIRYSGQVGNRLEFTWPSVDSVWGADVATVLPFVYVYTPSGEALYVDNLSLTENSSYFYINDSVDGAPENDQNTCNGEVDIGDGCVAFRDVTNKDLTYLSVVEAETEVNSSYTVNPCTIGATEEDSENCRMNPDTADGNVVLQVRPDRECAEWLSCQTASLTTDSEGNQEVTCLELGVCDELSDSGLCSNALPTTDADTLSSSSDITLRSSEGSTLTLDELKNASGYTKVGVRWANSDGTCSSGTCASDSPFEGEACSADSDCQMVNRVQGYYSYNEMVEEGTDGLSSTNDDLLADGDFEEVFCNVSPGNSVSFNGITSTYDTLFGSSRDKSQVCTIDDHCRNPETEGRLEELLSVDEQDSVVEISSSVNYSGGWCENPDAAGESYNNWDPSDTSTTISVIEYDPTVEFENPSLVFSDSTPSVGSLTLDFNNVLYVSPSGSGQGIDYDLDVDDVVNENQYSLSFRAAWAESAAEGDHLTVSFKYSDGTTDTDDFFHICDSEGNCGQTSVELTTELDYYALTVTAADVPEEPTSIYLAIHENADTSFFIDDISMMPSLEINKELNNIARECRAYPAEDALQCNYTDDNGSVYTGIHGYCLEKDGLFSNKCVTWWPLEKISGESDSRTKTEVRYTGRAPLYYCAVAKGVQDFAVCDGGQRDGAICSSYVSDDDGDGAVEESELADGDAYCAGNESSGDCVFGYSYYSSIDNNGADHHYPYDEIQGNSLYNSDGTAKPLNYQIMPRQIALVTTGNEIAASPGEGFYQEWSANAVETGLTMADIQRIRLELIGGRQDSTEHNYSWPQVGDDWDLSDEDTDGSGDWTNDSGGTVQGRYCYWTDHDITDDDGSITFVWDARESTSEDPRFCNSNPFTMSVNNGGVASDGDPSNGAYYDWGGQDSAESPSSKFETDENMFGVRLVFTDGILDYMQTVIWSAIGNDDVTAKLLFKYSLRESCVFAVQAVDEDGNTTPWMERMNGDTGHTLPVLGFDYNTAPTPYGAVVALEGEPNDWDADGDHEFFGTPDGALLIERNSATDMSAAPYACVGKCERPYCTSFDALGSSTPEEAACPETETDADGIFCSDEGYDQCSGAPKTSSDESFPNSAAGIEQYDSFVGSVVDYYDQIWTAAMVAREDLKTIIADLPGGQVWIRRENENNFAPADMDYFWNYSSDSSSNSIFENMYRCTSSSAESDYCGVPPTVYDLEVNYQTGDVNISDGESVTMTFGATAEDNQQPLQTVKILWEGQDGAGWDDADAITDNWDAAPITNYAYTHSYTCDETDSTYWEDESDSDGDGLAGVCVYEIRVQIEDNWNFCSGSIDASESGVRSLAATGEGCTSYDEFDSYILVSPD